jgi:hypothetical protein
VTAERSLLSEALSDEMFDYGILSPQSLTDLSSFPMSVQSVSHETRHTPLIELQLPGRRYNHVLIVLHSLHDVTLIALMKYEGGPRIPLDCRQPL